MFYFNIYNFYKNILSNGKYNDWKKNNNDTYNYNSNDSSSNSDNSDSSNNSDSSSISRNFEKILMNYQNVFNGIGPKLNNSRMGKYLRLSRFNSYNKKHKEKEVNKSNNDCTYNIEDINLNNNNQKDKYQNIKINEQFKRMNGKLNSIENQLRKRDRDVDSLMSDVSNVEKRVKINEKRWNRVVRLTNKLYYTVHSRRNNNEGNNSSSGYSS